MDIAAISIQQSLNSVKEAVSVNMLKRTMDSKTDSAALLIQDMQNANAAVNQARRSPDGRGQIIDIRV